MDPGGRGKSDNRVAGHASCSLIKGHHLGIGSVVQGAVRAKARARAGAEAEGKARVKAFGYGGIRSLEYAWCL